MGFAAESCWSPFAPRKCAECETHFRGAKGDLVARCANSWGGITRLRVVLVFVRVGYRIWAVILARRASEWFHDNYSFTRLRFVLVLVRVGYHI
ncbi:hypothetical protein Mal33_47650 [Rosistilla oblonga]|uniref:Uncharacterized protein n=1 Tax=Rosistilla oblonga TaxID=2527990 RepID=A0A518J080_9BACT|nr:hypothetical protein Mal33_47650 [Rosistilla oblonga]